jgi:hypothetical protein
MSQRSHHRSTIVSGIIAAALVTGAGAVTLSGTATAATTAAHTTGAAKATPTPVPALALALTEQDPHQTLQPGGLATTVIMKVTNTTGKAEQFTSQVSLWPRGALTLTHGDVSVAFTPVGAAPGLRASGNSRSHAVSIPAHATFTWKAEVRATKAWPRNDDGLGFEVGVLGQNPFVINKQMVWYAVGHAKTGGPVITALTGATRLAPGRPAVEKLTVTNRTGARIDRSLTIQADVFGSNAARLAIDEWVGSANKVHWQPLNGRNLVIQPGLANGVSATFSLRVRVTAYTAPTSSVHANLLAMDQDTTGPGTSAVQPLTVLRSA